MPPAILQVRPRDPPILAAITALDAGHLAGASLDARHLAGASLRKGLQRALTLFLRSFLTPAILQEHHTACHCAGAAL